jgi:hypothetical protein
MMISQARLGQDKRPVNPWVGGVLLSVTDDIQDKVSRIRLD